MFKLITFKHTRVELWINVSFHISYEDTSKMLNTIKIIQMFSYAYNRIKSKLMNKHFVSG